MAAGTGDVVGGGESMRSWETWEEHRAPIVLGGHELRGATQAFGRRINTESRDWGFLGMHSGEAWSLGGYLGLSFGGGRSVGGGAYISFSWGNC